MTKRIYCIVLFWLSIWAYSYGQKDMIILRTGLDFYGKIVLVSDRTIFKNTNGEQQEIPNRDLYMIKYDKRGNVFFTETGERITDTDSNGKIPKGCSAIYLIEGKEIIATNVSIDVDKVTFTPIQKKSAVEAFLSLSKKEPAVSMPKDQIFLIRHQDGTKDLITDFQTLKKREAEELERERIQEEAAKREKWLKSFPKSATIITKKEVVINAEVLSDDGNIVTYKRKSMDNSPIFTMEKENIQDVFYKDKL